MKTYCFVMMGLTVILAATFAGCSSVDMDNTWIRGESGAEGSLVFRTTGVLSLKGWGEI